MRETQQLEVRRCQDPSTHHDDSRIYQYDRSISFLVCDRSRYRGAALSTVIAQQQLALQLYVKKGRIKVQIKQ